VSSFVILIVVKKTVMNMGIKIFSSLPHELKGIEHFKVFKRKAKNYLLRSAFCSLQEYFVTSAD
jgi:hypothetical protein